MDLIGGIISDFNEGVDPVILPLPNEEIGVADFVTGSENDIISGLKNSTIEEMTIAAALNDHVLKVANESELGHVKANEAGNFEVYNTGKPNIEAGSGGTGNIIRKSEVNGLIIYQGFAPTGTAENIALWTINKIITSATGTIVSNVRYYTQKWTERQNL